MSTGDPPPTFDALARALIEDPPPQSAGEIVAYRLVRKPDGSQAEFIEVRTRGVAEHITIDVGFAAPER